MDASIAAATPGGLGIPENSLPGHDDVRIHGKQAAMRCAVFAAVRVTRRPD